MAEEDKMNEPRKNKDQPQYPQHPTFNFPFQQI